MTYLLLLLGMCIRNRVRKWTGITISLLYCDGLIETTTNNSTHYIWQCWVQISDVNLLLFSQEIDCVLK